MYKQILIPNKENHSIEMPEKFFGKKVEVIVIELDNSTEEIRAVPPVGKEVSISELFENFGAAHDFPSADEIRDKAWPSKW